MLNLLPVPATALVVFIVLASVMPQIGLAQSAALRAVPVYVAFAIIAPVVGRLVAGGLRLDAPSARLMSPPRRGPGNWKPPYPAVREAPASGSRLGAVYSR